jgi:hypothetical protein
MIARRSGREAVDLYRSQKPDFPPMLNLHKVAKVI